MNEFTPVTEFIQNAYTQARMEFDPDRPSMDECDQEFNRWCTQHDREVRDAERGAIARQLYYDAMDARYAWTAHGRGYQEALKDAHVWVTEGHYRRGQ